jgi:hypothetical protein
VEVVSIVNHHESTTWTDVTTGTTTLTPFYEAYIVDNYSDFPERDCVDGEGYNPSDYPGFLPSDLEVVLLNESDGDYTINS